VASAAIAASKSSFATASAARQPSGPGLRRGDVIFLLQDIRRTLVPGEQVGAVLGGDERLQRMDAREQANEIVFAPEREYRVDQVVPDAGFALLDLETVGEETEELI
jgi:hypothetical protein